MVEISVVAPCLNEESNIDELIVRTLKIFDDNQLSGELILVNDGSIDGTQQLLDEYSLKFHNVKAVHHEENKGITESWASGLDVSVGKYVVTIDADMQYQPEDILQLYNAMVSSNCDLVQGWRSKCKGNEDQREIMSKTLSWMLNAIVGTSMPDIKSGFVLYKKNVFKDILGERKKYLTFQHFFLLYAIKKDYCIERVPIVFHERHGGTSFIKNAFLFSCKVLYDLPRAIIEYNAFGRKRRKQ
ncbi:glycosyltransferase family 2 protein [Candidatus Omnitrophota bacterium]